MQLTVKDAASLLNVPEKTIYRWIQSSDLPAHQVEGQYRINRALLVEWATNRKIPLASNLSSEKSDASPLPTLVEALQIGGIHFNIIGTDKQTVIRSLVDALPLPESIDHEVLFSALWAREVIQSTAVGHGIAIPHVRNPMILDVDKPLVSLGFLQTPVDFGALDNEPVKILFTLITPTVAVHLHLLSRLAFVCRDARVQELFERQPSQEEILNLFQLVESTLSTSASPKGEG